MDIICSNNCTVIILLFFHSMKQKKKFNEWSEIKLNSFGFFLLSLSLYFFSHPSIKSIWELIDWMNWRNLIKEIVGYGPSGPSAQQQQQINSFTHSLIYWLLCLLFINERRKNNWIEKINELEWNKDWMKLCGVSGSLCSIGQQNL